MAAISTRDLRLLETGDTHPPLRLSGQTVVGTSLAPPVADQCMEDIALPHDCPASEVTNIGTSSHSETDFGPWLLVSRRHSSSRGCGGGTHANRATQGVAVDPVPDPVNSRGANSRSMRGGFSSASHGRFSIPYTTPLTMSTLLMSIHLHLLTNHILACPLLSPSLTTMRLSALPKALTLFPSQPCRPLIPLLPLTIIRFYRPLLSLISVHNCRPLIPITPIQYCRTSCPPNLSLAHRPLLPFKALLHCRLAHLLTSLPYSVP